MIEFADLQRQKKESRAQDARDLESGAKSAEELRRENGAFAFPDAEIDWDDAKLS